MRRGYTVEEEMRDGDVQLIRFGRRLAHCQSPFPPAVSSTMAAARRENQLSVARGGRVMVQRRRPGTGRGGPRSL